MIRVSTEIADVALVYQMMMHSALWSERGVAFFTFHFLLWHLNSLFKVFSISE
jgi:hypothetical protein